MSLKKIAELAGTSASTVSRVLNNHEHSCNTPGLAEKIWRIAGEMDYLPNIAARSLRMGTQPDDVPFSVDIFPARFDSLDKDFFFRELFQYIKEQLMAQGCLLGEVLKSIDIMELNEKRPQDAVIPYQPTAVSEGQKNPLAFVQRKANAGLIILGKCPKELFSTLKRRYSCIVGIDRNPTEYEYDEVICNGATAAEKAVEYLILLGHKNIAYIGDCTYESRYIGYYQALLNHKIPLNYDNIYPTGQTAGEGFRTMSAIIQSRNRPSAVFCANDCTALGVLRALKQHKRTGYLPSIISIDNIAESQKTEPMLTTIDIPKKEMGHLALMLLLDRKNGGHRENVRIELPCRLLERESCQYYVQ